MIEGMHTVWCQVSEMDRALTFYRDVLGLRVSYTSPYWTEFDLGNGKLGLHPTLSGNSRSPLGEFGCGWFVGLRTTDLQGLRERLVGAGVRIHGDYHDIPGGTVLDFEDPDGNALEAMQEGITAKQLGTTRG